MHETSDFIVSSIRGCGVDAVTQGFCGDCVCGSHGTRRTRNIQQYGLDDSQVCHLSAAEHRKLKPQDENRLECKIPGEIVKNHPKRNALSEVEETKDHPVREPLNVILVTRGFQGFEREISGEGPSDKVRHGCSEGVDKVEKD